MGPDQVSPSAVLSWRHASCDASRKQCPTKQPPQSNSLGFVVPVDDAHWRIVGVRRTSDPEHAYEPFLTNRKKWSEMTVAERQDFPNDSEAQVGQGPISLHSDEHLATSDKGIAMQRPMLTQQINAVAQGGDPIGVAFDEEKALVRVPSENFYRDQR
jgi:hypothetical protein